MTIDDLIGDFSALSANDNPARAEDRRFFLLASLPLSEARQFFQNWRLTNVLRDDEREWMNSCLLHRERAKRTA